MTFGVLRRVAPYNHSKLPGDLRQLIPGTLRLSLLCLQAIVDYVASAVTRVAVVRDTTQDDGTSQFATMHAMAPSLKMEVYPVNTPVKSSAALRPLARSGGLIVTASGASCFIAN